jgi:Na+-translocating ferredoxin:NAD+ oxidoreductase RnfD subunit
MTLRTPKAQLFLIFALLLAITAFQAPVLNLLVALVTVGVLDGLCMRIESGSWRLPTSALLTALIVVFVLSASESALVVAWTCAFAIAAKRLVRIRREHVFNPAALALLWAPIAFGSGESWWGALGDMPWPWIAVLVVSGALLTERLNKFPLVLTFLAAYFGLFTAVSVVQPALVAEMFRAPFVQAALFLAFFMLTDPPTSPNQYPDQVWYGLLAAVSACLAQLLGMGQTYLLVGVLAANTCLAAVRFWRRRCTARAIGAGWQTVAGE